MKRLVTIVAWSGILFSCIVLVLFITTPYLINSHLIPLLLKNNDILGVTVQIHQLTPWSTSGTINIAGDTDRETVRSHFALRYRPSDLLKRRVSSLTVDGPTIRLLYADGKLRLQDIAFLADRNSDQNDTFTIPSIPLIIETLEIDNVLIHIENTDHVGLPISLHASLRPEFTAQAADSFKLKSVQAELIAEGSLAVSLQATIDVNEDIYRLSLKGHIAETRPLSQLMQLPRHPQIRGPVHFEGELTVNSPFHRLDSIDGQIHFPGFTATTDDLILVSSTEQPLTVHLNGSHESLNYSVGNITVTSPSQIEASLQGKVIPASSELTGKMIFNSELLQHPEELTFQGVIHPENSTLTAALHGEKQQLQAGQNIIQLSSYTLLAHLQQKNDRLVITEDMQIGSVYLPHYDLLLENITSQMPVIADSGSHSDAQATLSIGKIHYKKENLAELRASIEATAEGAAFSGEIKSHMASPLRFLFSGTSSATAPLDLKANLPQSTINNSSFPSFVRLPSAINFSGKIQTSGTFSYSAGSFTGSTTLAVKELTINDNKNNIHASGIATEILFPSLPQLRSQSHQDLTIDTLDIGNLHFSDGRIVFQIEDAETLFVEKSGFTWCNGKIESGSLLIALNDPELSTTLYCDRLQFSELLSQIGISDTEGNGSLNGRLPLHFNGREIVFDDGFLFSTPGNSGIVRFNNTAILRQGLPDMGQAAYLEYSMQAMENFAYNWTKLTFNTTGEDLLISMQIDGKPATPLPFGYQSGQLVVKPEGQGIQHPIRLDVNFHLPFTQMFKYGQNLQKIMENMK